MSAITLSKELISHFKISSFAPANVGGQKTVFIVQIEGQTFALKVMNVADERFEREVRICQEFDSNPGIPKILKIEQFNKDTLILEEYIEGNDLHDLKTNYIGNETETIRLISKTIDILEPVWNAKYVHRDLKPQNLRIRTNTEPVVLDFGIARALDEGSLTVTGSQPLSWPHASPEQFLGRKELISYRTDFFSLGVIAYQLYTGGLPFGNKKKEVEQTMSETGALTFSSTGSDVIDQFCSSTLHRSPADRPRNVKVLKEMLSI